MTAPTRRQRLEADAAAIRRTLDRPDHGRPYLQGELEALEAAIAREPEDPAPVDSAALLMVESLLRDRFSAEGAKSILIRRRDRCAWVVTCSYATPTGLWLDQTVFSVSGADPLAPRHVERQEDPDACPGCGACPGESATYEPEDREVGVGGGWDGCPECIAVAELRAEEARTDMALEALEERERNVA